MIMITNVSRTEGLGFQNLFFISLGPLNFSPKCRKHVYRLYHSTRDCTTPTCKPGAKSPTLSLNVWMLLIKDLGRHTTQYFHFTIYIYILYYLYIWFLHSLLRLQKVCSTPPPVSRQPAVRWRLEPWGTPAQDEWMNGWSEIELSLLRDWMDRVI